MALNKTKSINKVEFAGKWKTLQVRHLVEVKDGDELIAQSYSRDSYQPNETLPEDLQPCLLYTSPSPRDRTRSRMPSSA